MQTESFVREKVSGTFCEELTVQTRSDLQPSLITSCLDRLAERSMRWVKDRG
jgi:hypothetical protein